MLKLYKEGDEVRWVKGRRSYVVWKLSHINWHLELDNRCSNMIICDAVPILIRPYPKP